MTNTIGKHSSFCMRAAFSLSLDIPRLLRWPPSRCSARPPTMPSTDTWGICNVLFVLVLATFPTKGFSANVNMLGTGSGRFEFRSAGMSSKRMCISLQALNIEKPVGSPGRNAERATSQEFTVTSMSVSFRFKNKSAGDPLALSLVCVILFQGCSTPKPLY